MYRGSLGILEVAGRARGRMETWHKWSFPVSPLSPGVGDPPGWRPVRKRRRISRFPLASGQILGRGARSAEQPGHDHRYGDGAQAPETAREEHERYYSLLTGHHRQGPPDVSS